MNTNFLKLSRFFWAKLILVLLFVNGIVNAAAFDPFMGDANSREISVSGDEKGPIIPNIPFSNDDISMAFQIISDATGWSIFPTSEVSKAKISLWAKDITAGELLDKVVTLAGFTYNRQGSIITVMTYEEYMQHYGLDKTVIDLKYADASSVAAVIKPFLTKLGKDVVHRETNTIVLYELNANLESILGIIQKLDTPSEDILVEVVELKYADCESLAKILQQVFTGQTKLTRNKGAGTENTGRITDSKSIEDNKAVETIDILVPNEQIGIYAVIHANQLVIVGTNTNIEKIKDLVTKIDIYGESMILEVIDLKFADAEMVAMTLQNVFSSGPGADKNTRDSISRPKTPQSPGTASPKVEIPGTKGMLIDPQSHIEVYAIGRTNQLIVKAFRTDLAKLKDLVIKLDVFVEPTTKSYHFTYVDAAEIYTGLERILDIYSRYGRSSASGGGSMNSQSRGKDSGITLVERTNTILLTGPPSAHRIMDSMCKSIDTPGTYETGMIKIYKIENADVDEIATTIKELLGQTEEEIGRPGEPKFKQPQEAPQEPGLKEMTETEEYVPQIQVKVSVNKATNSIVVQATGRQHLQLEKLIKDLDIRRKQVLIKAMIVEVTTTDDLDLGLELSLFERNGEELDGLAFTSFGLSTINPATGVRDLIVSPGGTAALLDPSKFHAIIKALQANDNIRIESTPQILVNNNAVGMIQSIAEEPTRQTNQGETTTTTSFGEYVTAGTQFAITPHISETDYLRVQYTITLNSFGEQADPELPPSRSTSTIQSEATIPDGSTIIVGGIQSSSESESIDKIPILGDIPLIGLLFRNTVIRKKYITTYLFITTTILRDTDFADLKDVSAKTLKEVKDNEDDLSNEAGEKNVDQ